MSIKLPKSPHLSNEDVEELEALSPSVATIAPDTKPIERNYEVAINDAEQRYGVEPVHPTIDKAFARWSRKIEGRDKDEMHYIGYESTDTFAASERWGTWVEDRERLEVSKNIPYNLYGDVIEKAIELYKDPERQHKIVEAYQGFFQQCPTLETDNKQYALVAAAVAKPYFEMLDEIHEESDLTNNSYRIATRHCGRFIGKVNVLVEEALSNSNGIPSALIPFLIEVVASAYEEFQSKLDTYPRFNPNYERKASKVLSSQLERLNYFREGLQSIKPTEYKSVELSNNEGWLFYHTADTFPQILVADGIICSHCPDFPIASYYTHESHTRAAGVLLSGEWMQAFCDDQMTSGDFEAELALALAGKWSLETKIRRLYETTEYREAQEAGYDNFHDYIDRQIEIFTQNHANNLKDAWVRGPGRDKSYRYAFTEVWLKNAIPYALWVDFDLESNPGYITNGRSVYSVIDLLKSRPDLPVFDIHGKLVNRKAVTSRFNEINAKLLQTYEDTEDYFL